MVVKRIVYQLLLVCAMLFGLMQSATAADVIKGKKLFNQQCVYCHKLNYDDKFGPGLAGISERRDNAWLDAFLKDPEAVIKNDDYAQALRETNEYNLTMPKLPSMQDDKKREDVIAYLGTL